MEKITNEKFLEELKNVKNIFSYHQKQVDSKHIEFGWVKSNSIDIKDGPVVIAKDLKNPEWDNVATLNDYKTFFLRLTSLKPNDFANRWIGSANELKNFWRSTHPSSPDDQHEFILKLSVLLRDGEAFKMYGKKYEIFGLESGEKSVEEGNKE
jgi:hypothetical protein